MKIFINFIIFILLTSNSFTFTGKGSGTEADPYQITNIYELQEIKDLKYPKDEWSYFVLINDIDASETSGWNVGDHDKDPTTPDQPKGFIPFYFRGYFEGNGHVIRNLFINKPGDLGASLFGQSFKSTIRRLGLENYNFIGGYYSGGLLGDSYQDTVEECFTKGTITAVKSKTDSEYPYYISGFCGHSQESRIRNCYSNCILYVDTADDKGVTSFSNAFVHLDARYCYTTGKVNCSNNKVNSYYPNDDFLSSCYWDTDVTGIPENDPYNGAHGLTTAEMMKRSSYIWTWDFEKIWYIDEGKDYPKLRAFKKDTTDVISDVLTSKGFSVSISPNPVDQSSRIIYTVSSADFISINLYGTTGFLEKNIVKNEFHNAGNYVTELDVNNIQCGVYIIVLNSALDSSKFLLFVIK